MVVHFVIVCCVCAECGNTVGGSITVVCGASVICVAYVCGIYLVSVWCVCGLCIICMVYIVYV